MFSVDLIGRSFGNRLNVICENPIHQVPFDLSDEIQGITESSHKGWMTEIGVDSYDKLPGEVKNYLQYLEEKIGLPITYVSTGPGREELIVRN